MVSDQEIAKGVEILLTQSDHKSFTSLGDVVHQLGDKLGFDLSHKALFIRDQINQYLFRSQSQQPQYHHPPPPLQPAVTTSSIAKDHFALRHAQYRFTPPQPQFHQTYFALQQQQQQRQRHPVEVRFSKTEPPLPTVVSISSAEPAQLQPAPEVKAEGGVGVQDAGGKSSGKPKKGWCLIFGKRASKTLSSARRRPRAEIRVCRKL